MNDYKYFYFDKPRVPFCFKYKYGTLINQCELDNCCKVRVESVESFNSIIDAINQFASLVKEIPYFFLSIEPNFVRRKLPDLLLEESLDNCFINTKIDKKEYADEGATITLPVNLLIIVNQYIFWLVITFPNYLEIKESMNYSNEMGKTLFLDYSFSLEKIPEDGDLLLREDLVYDGGSFKVQLKKGNESCHNRPHVQAIMDGESYNISIDDNIQCLSNKPKKNHINFLVKEIKKDKILQKARRIWNSIPSNYKFIEDEHGNLVCPNQTNGIAI